MQPLTARAEWRRAWHVALAAAIGYASSYSAFGYVVSIFVSVFADHFGWSRGEIALAGNASIMGGLAAPFWGRAVDRWGMRPVALTAIPVLSAAYVAMTFMTQIWHYYALYCVTAGFGISLTTMTYGRAISSWFARSRGLALSTCGMGLTLMGVILPPMLYYGSQRFGWSAVCWIMAAMPMLVAFPLTFFFVRENPDGIAPPPKALEARDGAEVRWQAQLRDYRFWALCVSAALTVGTVVGLLSQLQPLLKDAGLDGGTASALLGVIGVASFIGAIASGTLIDRIWAPLLGFAFTALPVAGCLILTDIGSAWMAALAIGMVGFAYGVEMQILGYLMARYFGLRTFGTLIGIYTFGSTGACAVWMSGFGLVYDHYGSYRPALIAAAGSFALSALLYLVMGPYPDRSRPVGT